MANYNTFQEYYWKPFAQSVTSTAETNLLVSAGGANMTLPVPNWKGIFDGKGIQLGIAGFVTTDTTGTATLKMYYSSTAAGAKTTQIGKTGASQSLATASTNFSYFMELMWDSTSQAVNGTQYGEMGTTLVAYAVLTNPIASIADISAGFWFQPTITFSAVTTAATIKVTDFHLDVV